MSNETEDSKTTESSETASAENTETETTNEVPDEEIQCFFDTEGHGFDESEFAP